MDLDILIWFHQTFHDITWLNYVFKYVTVLGEGGAIAIVTALILLFFKKTRWVGVTIAVALILDVLLVDAFIKNVVGRPRPYTEYEGFLSFYDSIGLKAPTSKSFPSGHTASSFCAAIVLLINYKSKAIPAVVLAAIIGLSRLYLCVHYPTDVLVGMLVGITLAIVAHLITTKFIRPKFEKILAKKKSA